jgi:hypothetical protein
VREEMTSCEFGDEVKRASERRGGVGEGSNLFHFDSYLELFELFHQLMSALIKLLLSDSQQMGTEK